ncbi:translation initiation factor IF-2 [Candidatus Bathyarchaeota archaeon]|nr:translation initiation factor IF-2 [Candidatus Bathyarchaeota archaeon]
MLKSAGCQAGGEQELPIRQPIVCVLGHVDTGKTLLLDKIRKSSVQAREAGGITQHIGASFFPVETLKEISGPLLRKIGGEIKIPGLLVIDTPGHEAFANLRRRGGSVADIAILVIDILKGFEAQTYESLEVLKSRRTPFLVAANKIDRIPGWKPQPTFSFLESYKQQDPYVKQALDDYLYRIIGRFSELSFRADRFDRVRDFTRTVAIVPTSAKTGEGITELVAVLTGLTQQFLRRRLQVTSGPAKGTILEVKEEVGLGTTVNAIIYDGILRRDDIIVLGGRNGPIVTTVRALLLPKPLDEIRDPRDKFSSVNEVSAAVGVKIAAPNLEDALAGAPLYVAESNEKIDDLLREVSEEVERLRILTDVDGVILKTDALGSLEAIAENLKRNDIPIRFADVGDVSKRDVIEASVVKENKPLYGVILAFNVRVLPDAEEEAKIRGIPLFCNNIIYHLIDDYLRWLEKKKAEIERGEFERLVKPAKIKILPGYIFRRAKPAIVGVEVLAGTIKPRLRLIREDGKEIGEILQIQDRGKAIPKADKGSQVAISIDKPVVGRHIDEGDILYVNVPEAHARQLFSKFMERLSSDEIECLNEIAEIMSTKKPFWGR